MPYIEKKVIVITGASDGIGKSAAEMLAKDGHTVIVIGHDPQKTEAVAVVLNADYFTADFSDLSQVRSLADQLTKKYPRIDVLVNNAGAVFGERKVTKDGFEITNQVNFVVPFLLTQLLLPTLIASNAVVINTASIAARLFGNIDINDLQAKKCYNVNKAYGNSKLALILFTQELDRRYRNRGIRTVSFHPGNLATNFAKDSASWFRFVYHTPFKVLIGKPEVGGKALKWLIDGTPGKDWQVGGYYENNALAKKVNPQIKDKELAKRLWYKTEASLKPYLD